MNGGATFYLHAALRRQGYGGQAGVTTRLRSDPRSGVRNRGAGAGPVRRSLGEGGLARVSRARARKGIPPSAACRSSGARQEHRVEDAGRRSGLVVAGGRERPRVADHAPSSNAASRCARSPSTRRPARKSSTSRCSRSPRDRRDINPKNSWASPTPVVDGDRVYVHFGADGTAALSSSGEIIWKNRFEYQSQHGAGGSPIVYRRSVDLQLRRQRRGVRDRARQAHRQDEVEDQSRLSGRSGVHDAARDSRRRAGSADQRRRVSRRVPTSR